MPDDLDDLDRRPTRAHAFDSNGVRVSCLPCKHEPFDGMCTCGHHVVAASPEAVIAGLLEHSAWADAANIHA